MLRLLADENFDGRIVRGLRRRAPQVDVLRVQDTDIAGAQDPDLLEWAAANDRLLLSHDISTIPAFAAARVAAGLRMPGVIMVSRKLGIGQAIEQILLLAECSRADEWEGQEVHIPL